MIEIRPDGRSGNVLLALYAAIGAVAVVGAVGMNVMKGPVRGMQQVTQKTIAENNMIAAGKLALMAAVNQPDGGDCDGDGTIEPVPFQPAGSVRHPTGGGHIPNTISAAKLDPWGNEYGYCVWDHGTMIHVSTCGSNSLRGAVDENGLVIAMISSGPDRTFQTSCANAPAFLNRYPGSDDIILAYSYAEAATMSGGLWNLKPGEPGTAEISKDLEVLTPTGHVAFGVDTRSDASRPSVKTDYINALTRPQVEMLSPLRIAKAQDGPEILRLETERPWVFEQSGTGGNADLDLRSTVDSKSFSIKGSDGSYAASFHTHSSPSNRRILLIPEGGRVGIGTDNPVQTLHVAGTGQIDETLVLRGTTGHLMNMLSAGENNWSFYNNAFAGKADNVRARASGTGLGSLWWLWSSGDSTANWLGLNPTSRTIDAGGPIAFGQGINVAGPVRIDNNNSYDVWLQGGTATNGNDRNLALLGHKSQDRLYLNYGGEYTGGTQIGGPVIVSGGTLNMSSNKIVGLAAPTAAADATTKSYVDARVVAEIAGFVEQDPQVGTLTNGRWCTTNGSTINCTQTAPVLTEADPKVGTITNGRWCRAVSGKVVCDQTTPVAAETDPQVGTLTDNRWCRSNSSGTQIICDRQEPAAGGQITGITNYSSDLGCDRDGCPSVTSGLHSFCVLASSHDSTNMRLSVSSGPDSSGQSKFKCEVTFGSDRCRMICFDM